MYFFFLLHSFTARTFVLIAVSAAFGHSLSFLIKLRDFNFLLKILDNSLWHTQIANITTLGF